MGQSGQDRASGLTNPIVGLARVSSGVPIAWSPNLREKSEIEIIKSLVQETSGVVTDKFIAAIVQQLVFTLGIKIAFIGKIVDEEKQVIQTVSMFDGQSLTSGLEYSLQDTPCQNVMRGEVCFYSKDVHLLFPRDVFLSEYGIKSYFGVPILDRQNVPIGLLSILHDQALERTPLLDWIMNTFARRVAVELEYMERERELQRKVAFEDMLISVSTKLVNLSATEGERGIVEALQTVAKFCGAELGCLALFDEDGKALRVSHNWRLESIPVRSGSDLNLIRERYTWLWDQFERGETVNIRSLERLSDSAKAEKILLHEEGVRSLVAVPLKLADRLIGVVALCTLREERKWSEYVISVLRIVGEMFLNLLQRERAAEDLKKSERTFRDLAENIEEVFWLFDLKAGRNVYVCPSFKTVWGIEHSEIEKVKDGFLNTVHPDDRERIQKAFKLQPKGEYNEEYRIVRPDGSLRWISDRAFPIRDDHGEVVRIAGIARDITERVNALRIAKESEERFRGYFQQPLVGMAISTPKLKLIEVNERLCELFGFSEEELLKQSWEDLTHKEDWDESVQRYERGASGDLDSYSFEKRYVRKDGSILYAMTSVSWVREPSAGEPYIISVIQDISKLKEVEHELRRQKEYLQQVVDSNPNMIFVKNPEGRFELVNNSFADFYQMEREEIIGLTDSDFHLSLKEIEDFRQADLEVLQTGRPFYLPSLKVTDRLGEERWFRSIKTPLLVEDGKVRHILGVATEITDIKRVEAEREKLIADSAVTSRLAAIGELAAGVAHEINNPLTGIINYAQLVLDQGLSEKNVDYLHEIISEGERIASIVRNLLTFSRTNEQPFSRADIMPILRASLQLIETQMRKDHILVDIVSPDELPPLRCAPQQIQQVFINLLSNARYALNQKYPRASAEKRLTITLSPVSIGNKNFLRTEFWDRGIGIPDEIKESIFDPFFSTKPHGEGTGIGLSISYGIIDKHGGKITFESKHSEFTKAIVDVPIFEAEAVGMGC